MSVTIRPAVESDLFAWHALYSGYGEFYGNPLTDEKAVLVWGWLSDPTHPLTALVAEDEAVGVAVESDAGIGPVLQHRPAELLGMVGAAAIVDVEAVGRGAEPHHLGP